MSPPARTREPRALRVATAFVATVAGAGCSSESGGAAITTSETCTSDFNCPATQSCDLTTGTCVDGVVQDNHLSGTVQFILGALAPADAGPNTGAVAVSGSVGGQRLEISAATSGQIDTDDPAVLLIALQGRTTNDNLSLSFTFATAVAARTGPFTIDPYANYATDNHAFFAITRIVGAHPDISTDPVVAYSVKGTGTIVSAASENGQTLSMTIDATVQAPGVVPKCMTSCTSQADCGAAAGGTEGTDYPECFEEWDGGPRLCSAWLCDGTGAAACAAAGGVCVNALCEQPVCSNLTTDPSCASLTVDNCEVCCNEESQGGQTTFNRLLYSTCGCNAGATCHSECSGACCNDSSGSGNCTTCVSGSNTCISSVVKACDGYSDCNAFLACQARCPS
jgi:hypothetical protein